MSYKENGMDHHQSAMHLMTWAMEGLLPKLHEFLKQVPNLQTSMKKDIESLATQLRRMDAALVRMPRVQQDQVVVDPKDDDSRWHWAYKSRELSYDIQDIVDNLITWLPIINQDSFSKTLENIKVPVKNMATSHAANFVPTTTSIVGPCLEDGSMQVRGHVGVHKLRAELISQMYSSSQRLKIVYICAPGGMGKTTLAKAVYDKIKGDFISNAFVSVGRQAGVKKAMRDILIDLGKKWYSDLNIIELNEGQLIDELKHFLKNKRFLIVVDDIPDIPSWEVIKCALVDNGCGSRVITTSRVLGVAKSSGDSSKEIFYATLCGHKSTNNFDPIDEQTNNMEGKGIDHHQCIVDLMRLTIGCLLHTLGEFLKQEPIINQDNFRDMPENIMVRVKNLSTWYAPKFVPTTTSTVGPCLDKEFMQVRHLVGVHKLRAELISKMSSSSQRLKIVSIRAHGGIGKTTLAKAVYDNIKWEFNFCAFVSAGQQPNMKKALRDILIHLDKKRYSNLNMTRLNEGQLIHELQHFLKNKRFLIVIDGIKNVPSSEVIRRALFDNDCGSRIITTSRILESSGEVFKLMPLSLDGSKELFYATLCGHQGTINFDLLDKQTTKNVLRKCCGVPLAIIMIASLLAGKPQEEWTEVYNSIGFGQEDDMGADENNTRKIIQFSYYDLPSHLKTCLLYLSIFPDDHVIEKDTLVWRWVAEGFVHDDEEQGESLFKVGERYLHELVSRSMIQAVENEDTSIRGCRVEGMVLDWIRTVAKDKNFVTVSGDWCDHDQHLFCHQSSSARIMAVHNRALDKLHDDLAGMWKPKVWSFNGIGCSTSGTTWQHRTFQALRVLSLEGCKLNAEGSDGLKNLVIEGLLYLRYLGLHGTDIENLTIGIGGLRYLQTLDLTETYIRELPSGVTQLRQLKCLRCFAPSLELPEGMGNLTSLEELQMGMIVDKFPNCAKELSKLTELRVLHIDYRESFDAEWMEALVESLSKLQKIEELELSCDELSSDDMTCRHVIAPGGFPKMRHLRTNIWLMFQPGAMPCLKSVELQVNVRAFKDANFDFHDLYKLSLIRLLEKARVRIVCWRAKMEEVEEAEAALRYAVESHPNRPRLILNRVGRCIDDKQISLLSGLHDSGVAPQFMPLELLRQITNNFSEERKLGSGAFGTVYKGVLKGKVVAVKLLNLMSQRLNYEEDFMKEFENLRRLDHPNIVQLLGYCYEIKRVCVEYGGRPILADEIYRAICFEYMCKGSLQQHIDDKVHRLDWWTCYKIIKGTCEGLKYLHEGSATPMYHLDIKPANILLNKNMVPKIADFGLSKLVLDNETRATSSSFGTIKYCPPEYINHGNVSNKFDIFSLGVVMIELIAGSEGYNKAYEMPSQEFINHVQENWRKRLQATPGCTSLIYERRQVQRCIEIALDCISADRKQRPNIGDITSWLNEIESNTEKLATTFTSQNET